MREFEQEYDEDGNRKDLSKRDKKRMNMKSHQKKTKHRQWNQKLKFFGAKR